MASHNRDPLRLRLTALLFAGSLLLLAAPVASAYRCQKHYEGFGETTFAGQPNYSYFTQGDVIDDCGGDACDDNVIGVIYTNDEGDFIRFSVEEYGGSNDNCDVICSLGAEQWKSTGSVRPYHYGADYTCSGSFYGFVDEDYYPDARIIFVLPVLASA